MYVLEGVTDGTCIGVLVPVFDAVKVYVFDAVPDGVGVTVEVGVQGRTRAISTCLHEDPERRSSGFAHE